MPAINKFTIRPPVKILTGLGTIAVLLFGALELAHAKGTLSVTLSNPGIDQPVELMTETNPDLIARLMKQAGFWYDTGVPVDEPTGELGPAYTLTWVNGGPPGESEATLTIRQEIYFSAENGPLIYTPEQDSFQNWGPGVTGWFAAPGEMYTTLLELGAPLPAAASLMDSDTSEKRIEAAPLEDESDYLPWFLAGAGLALLLGLAAGLGARRMME